MAPDCKSHWEQVYATKTPEQCSWTQITPSISLNFIAGLDLSSNASIIDVGGGDSKLVDELLQLGFTDVTVLDISKNALDRAKARLGSDSGKVTWIEADINPFQPERQYDLWHDRAAFHFLIEGEQIRHYFEMTRDFAARHLIVGAFSNQGPTKCSGLDIRQYSEKSLSDTFGSAFDCVSCTYDDHQTPFGTVQHFVFCRFDHQ